MRAPLRPIGAHGTTRYQRYDAPVPALVDSTSHRVRLLAGLAAAVDEKGYGATTVADVVRHARVSKRTFYEQFADKTDCLVELALAATDGVLAEIEAAVELPIGWEDRLERAVRAYFERVESGPALFRTYLAEAQSAGPRAVRFRREAYRRYATLLCELSRRAAAEAPEYRPMSRELATAIVGGINELVLEAIEEGRSERLTELVDPVVELIRAVVIAPPRR
jgi:AcrR family transcriptional regulator